MFYREVDTLMSVNGNKLREIEEYMFKNLVKGEVEEQTGVWTGSNVQNKMADEKISKGVKSSFRTYEKNYKDASFVGKFFHF